MCIDPFKYRTTPFAARMRPALGSALCLLSRPTTNAMSDPSGCSAPQIMQTITRCIDDIRTRDTPIHLHWIPAHTDIKGNEEADVAAKEAMEWRRPKRKNEGWRMGFWIHSRKTEKFLYFRKVPGFDSPECPCRRGMQSAKHMLTECRTHTRERNRRREEDRRKVAFGRINPAKICQESCAIYEVTRTNRPIQVRHTWLTTHLFLAANTIA